MILGIGIDIVDVARIEKAILKKSFMERVFSKSEIEYCAQKGKQSAASFAARFAAKEAFLKALGTGLRGGKLLEVEVENNSLGKPEIKLSGYFKALTEGLGVKKIHLSMSHLKDYALAEVILDKEIRRGSGVFLKNKISSEILEEWEKQGTIITNSRVKSILPQRLQDVHKGSCGKVSLVAGSLGFTGAAALSSFAAVKAGAGLVTLLTKKEAQAILAIKLDEVMVQSIENCEQILSWGQKSDAQAIGPGFGTDDCSQNLVRDFLEKAQKPVVIDADALTSLASKTVLLEKMKVPKILTPHSAEFARLVGCSVEEVNENRAKLASFYAKKWNCVLVLKGFGTIVALSNGDVFINPTGCSAMATGGSGDVLTGIIVALLAQGLSASNAAIAGVYIHGLAGEIASNNEVGLAAGEISMALPKAREVILFEK